MTPAQIDLHEVYASTFGDHPPPAELRHGALAYPEDWDVPSVRVELGDLSEVVRFEPGDGGRMREVLDAVAERLHRQRQPGAPAL